MNACFVTIHGIDGTGKTTAVECATDLLSQRGFSVNDEVILTSKPTYSLSSELTDLTACDENVIKSLKKKINQSLAIRSINASGEIVVRDRWLIDVYADNTFKGYEMPEISRQIICPDLSVLLFCDEAIRQKRIAERPNPTVQDLIPNIEGTRAYYFENYLKKNIAKFALRSITIDSSEKAPNEISEIIVREMENLNVVRSI